MKDEWKAETVKQLFKYEITRDELAKEAKMTTSYLNMILAGTRNPPDAEDTITSALVRLIVQKQAPPDSGGKKNKHGGDVNAEIKTATS